MRVLFLLLLFSLNLSATRTLLASNIFNGITSESASFCYVNTDIDLNICAPVVTAQFSMSNPTGCALPHNVFFTDQSTQPDVWSWDFGDGGSSSLQNPVHTYTSTGMFIVKLTVSDTIIGSMDTFTDTINVSVVDPGFSFTGGISIFSPQGCDPLTINFQDTSSINGPGSISGWLWNFGDGTTSSSQNPSHTYQNTGTYTISLIAAASNGCSNSVINNNYVQVIAPTANFGADILTGCDSLTVNFTDSTVLNSPLTSFLWEFGDGNSSNLQNPTHQYTSFGNFNVTLIVNDLNGCTDTIIKNNYITTLDTTAPIISCPNNASFFANISCNGLIPDFTDLAITSDNCDHNPTVTQKPVIGTMVFDTDTLIWLFSTDADGNVDSCFFTATISDTIPPTINCPGTQTILANTSCNGLLLDYTPLATTSDNCDNAPVVSQSPIAGTVVFDVDTIVWLYSTDASGNIDSCSFTVTITDAIPPNITCPINSTFFANNSCGGTLLNYTSLAITSDNCDNNPIITQKPNPGTVVFNNDTLVWLFSTDASGNVDSCSFTATISDTIPPTINCPGTQTILTNASCNGLLADYTTLATTSDNCDNSPAITQSPIAGTIVFNLDTTVWLYSTDVSGNVDSCSFIITITDTISPNITCPINPTFFANNLCGGTLLNYTSLAITSDNCDNSPVITQKPNPGTIVFNNDTLVWLFSTDASGNVDSCSFTATIIDTINPIIICPPNQTIFANASCNGLLTDFTTLGTTSDNCDNNPIISQSPSAGTVVFNNDTIVWLFSTDVSGNIDSCSFIVTIIDTIAPTISCPINQTIFSTTSCNGTLSNYISLAISSDNCDSNPVISQNPAPGTIIFNTDTTVWLFSTDVSGNIDSCSFIVTIIDTIVPNITCPANQTIFANNSCSGSLNDYTALAATSDNCDNNPIISQNPSAGTIVFNTDTIVWLFSTDASGNVDSCSFIVTITDTIPPAISCPINQTIFANTSCSGSLNDYTALATTSDNCDNNPITSQNPSAGTVVFNTDTVVWLFSTDVSGNVDSCSFIVTITDTIAPTITCPFSQTIFANTSCSATLNNYISLAITSDNCDNNPTITQNPAPGTIVFNADTVVWLFSTDDSGNIDSCSFIVTIIDTIAPTISCPTNQTIFANLSCSGVLNDYSSLAITSDNCDNNPTITQNPISGTTVFSVDTIVWLFSTDASGNTDSCSFIITIVDTIAPILNNLNNITSCDPIVNFNLPVATDNCDTTLIISQLLGLPSGSAFPIGITSNIFTATDQSGNSDTVSFIVEIFPSPILSSSVNNITCNTFSDGSINITITDGLAPFSYLWSTADTTEDLNGLASGIYSLVVTDANTCTDTIDVNVSEPNPISINETITSISCFGDSNGIIATNVAGGTSPYIYNWTGGITTSSISNLPTGNYSLNVIDNNLCSLSVNYTLTEPDSIFLAISGISQYGTANVSAPGLCNGTVDLSVTGGSGNYTFSWSSGDMTEDLFFICAGTYTALVNDDNNCSASIMVTLTEPENVDPPEGFSPNGDGINDTYIIPSINLFPNNSFKVFNRHGNVSYEASPYLNNWDGTSNKTFIGDKMPDGSYFYQLKLREDTILTGYIIIKR